LDLNITILFVVQGRAFTANGVLPLTTGIYGKKATFWAERENKVVTN
jgi:hypothetical protein